jgi:hypothetical protein
MAPRLHAMLGVQHPTKLAITRPHHGKTPQLLLDIGHPKFAFAGREDLSCAPPEHPTCIRLAHYKSQDGMHGTAELSHRARDIDDQHRT